MTDKQLIGTASGSEAYITGGGAIITPLGQQVLMKRHAADEIKGSIIIPDQARTPPRFATVLACGPTASKDLLNKVVMFHEYTKTEINLEEEEFVLVDAADLVAILENLPEATTIEKTDIREGHSIEDLQGSAAIPWAGPGSTYDPNTKPEVKSDDISFNDMLGGSKVPVGALLGKPHPGLDKTALTGGPMGSRPNAPDDMLDRTKEILTSNDIGELPDTPGISPLIRDASGRTAPKPVSKGAIETEM